MTEVEWMAVAEPFPMLEYIKDDSTDRKLCLLACALCDTYRKYLNDDRSLAALGAVTK